jgi:putative RecB family exonuclease
MTRLPVLETPEPGTAPAAGTAPPARTALVSAASGDAESALPEAIVGSLSPSRAADFKTCPLLYRYRTIDKLPEAPTRAAVRGTVVHAVLEHLFDLPPLQRTVEAAKGDVEPSWAALVDADPSLEEMFTDDAEGAELAGWLESARDLLANYFELEDPARLEPAGREQLVEVVVDGLRLRGYIDRLDISPAGDIRVVDYKTGSIPREAFEAKALFQMKFYALVLWRTRGVVPRQLRLMYLSDRDTLSYRPDAQELERFERTVRAIWKAIARATLTGDFRASPSRLCDWCSHHAHCPAQGGTPLPFPASSVADSMPDTGYVSDPARSIVPEV